MEKKFDYVKVHTLPENIEAHIDEVAKLPMEIVCQGVRLYGTVRLVIIEGMPQKFFFIVPLDEYKNDFLQFEFYSSDNFCEGKVLPKDGSTVSFSITRYGQRTIANNVCMVMKQ